MPHGQPDFGMYQLAKTIYRLSDMGELAVRLGSIVRFDRRGDVIFLEDFEGALNRWTVAYGDAEISSDYSLSGSFSCKLTPPAVNEGSTALGKYVFPTVLSKVGIETTLLLHSDVDLVTIGMVHTVGEVTRVYHIRYSISAQTLGYQTGVDEWTQFSSGLRLSNGTRPWHVFKLVVDLTANKFQRLLIDGATYDISSLDPRVGELAVEDSVNAVIAGERIAALTGSMYVDNAIITQNEP